VILVKVKYGKQALEEKSWVDGRIAWWENPLAPKMVYDGREMNQQKDLIA